MKLSSLGFRKVAKTALIRHIRMGTVSEKGAVNAVKKLKMKPREVKDIGQGGEGVATLTTSPTKGLEVTKSMDVFSGMFNSSDFKVRNAMSKRLNKSDLFANFHGQKGKHPITKHEFMKDTKPYPEGIDHKADVVAKKLTGRGVLDVRPDNVVGGKVIDYVPMLNMRDFKHAGNSINSSKSTQLSLQAVNIQQSLGKAPTRASLKHLSKKQKKRVLKGDRDRIKAVANRVEV